MYNGRSDSDRVRLNEQQELFGCGEMVTNSKRIKLKAYQVLPPESALRVLDPGHIIYLYRQGMNLEPRTIDIRKYLEMEDRNAE